MEQAGEIKKEKEVEEVDEDSSSEEERDDIEQTTDSDPDEVVDMEQKGEIKAMSQEDARTMAEGLMGHFLPLLEQIAGKLDELE